MDKILNFRCPLDLWIAIEERAKSHNITKTDVVLYGLDSMFGKKYSSYSDVLNNTLYRITLGERHWLLREKFLKFNLRQMAIFYGIERVSDLESYERGDEELPLKLLNKLTDFFFINWEYFDGESNTVFRTFDLNSERPFQLIKDGFKPCFLSSSEERENLLVYSIFQKIEQGYRRIIQSNLVGSFGSSGGGANNIYRIIYAMLRNGMSAEDVKFYQVSSAVWQLLGSASFYSRDMNFGSGFSADEEAAKYFFQWFELARTKYQEEQNQSPNFPNQFGQHIL